MLRLLFLILLCAPLVPLPASAATERIAVLEFRGPGELTERFLATLSDETRAGALDASAGRDFLVMTRESQAVLLKDMGQSCAEEGECEVETARSLHAQYVVSGEVVDLRGVLRLTLKLHETKKGALLAIEAVQARDQLELIGMVRGAAAVMIRKGLRLSAAAPPVAAPSGTEEKFGPARTEAPRFEEMVVVKFASEPPGAIVRVGDTLLCQATPCSRELPTGAHQITMEHERYRPLSKRIEARRGATVSMELEPTFGWLNVITSPPNLTIHLDGKPIGKSPLRNLEVDPGMREVKIAEPCWANQGERLIVQTGQEREIRIDAVARTAFLSLRAEDSRGNALELEVLADGRRLGLTPGHFEVPICTQEIVLRDDDQRVLGKHRIRLREGEVKGLVARHDPLPAPEPHLNAPAEGWESLSARRAALLRERELIATRKAYGWTFTGVGAASAGTSLLFMALGSGINTDLNQGTLATGQDIQAALSTGKTYNSLAWVFGIGSVASLTAGIILLATSPDPGDVQLTIIPTKDGSAGGLAFRFH